MDQDPRTLDAVMLALLFCAGSSITLPPSLVRLWPIGWLKTEQLILIIGFLSMNDRHGVWSYKLTGEHHRFTMVGPKISEDKAMNALLMHFPRERIADLRPVIRRKFPIGDELFHVEHILKS